MSGAIIMVVVAAALVIGFVFFYRHTRSSAWSRGETRHAMLRVLVALGPMLGIHVKEPRPTPPAITTPWDGDDRERDSDPD